MSTIAKAVAANAALVVATARTVPGTQVVTAISSDPAVEAANPPVGAFFSDAPSVYQEESRGEANTGGQGKLPPQPLVRMVVNAPSQAFAALVEHSEPTERAEGGGVYRRPKGFMGVISKVIEIYETTARVISGTNGARGESITLSL